jgi:hypothetical protein
MITSTQRQFPALLDMLKIGAIAGALALAYSC